MRSEKMVTTPMVPAWRSEEPVKLPPGPTREIAAAPTNKTIRLAKFYRREDVETIEPREARV